MPLDGSKNSLRGLKFALGIAKQSKSSIIGLNVIPESAFMKTSLNLREKSEKIIKEAETTSQKTKVLFTGVSKVGSNIGKVIVTFAENHKTDMIVIGSRGPDPEIEVFLGSVANHVVNKSKIPVTIVK